MLTSQVSYNTQPFHLNSFVFNSAVTYDWVYPSGATDYADFYYSTDDNPNWTFIATKQPQGGGIKEIMVDYQLPLATIHRVRVNFRYNGGPSPCSNGSYDDHDDLVFAVSDSSSTSVTNSPTNKPTQKPTPLVRIHARYIICMHLCILSDMFKLLFTQPTNIPTHPPTPLPTPLPTPKPTQSPTKRVSIHHH